MKNVTFLILLLIQYANTIAGTRHDYTLQVEGYTRQFIVSEPTGSAPAEGYPVVFMFHGTSGDGEKFFNISGWKEKGDAESFISVFPSSLEFCINEDGKQKNTTKWVCGDLLEIACQGQEFPDDVHFVRKIIDTLRTLFPINTNRIYGSGFSNGGCFTSKLAIEAGDMFAALSAHAGSLHVLDSAKALWNTPLWLSVGSKDDRWLENTTLTEFPFNDSTLGYLQRVLRRNIDCLGLADSYTKNTQPIALTYFFSEPSSDENTSEFRFTLIKGLYHQYPNGENVPYVLADYLWPFFNEYSLSLKVSDEKLEGVKIYPNPATDYIEIQDYDPAVNHGVNEELTVCNVLGRYILTKKIQYPGPIRMDVSSLPSGVYYLLTGTESKLFVKE